MSVIFYIVVFVLCSLIGWIGDTFVRSVTVRRYTDGSFFNAPLCPIYGFGALIILFLHALFGSVPLLGQGVIYGITLAAFEYASGLFVFRVFRRRLWKYSGALNLGGYTDITHAVLWGILGGLLVTYIQPFVQSIISY